MIGRSPFVQLPETRGIGKGPTAIKISSRVAAALAGNLLEFSLENITADLSAKRLTYLDFGRILGWARRVNKPGRGAGDHRTGILRPTASQQQAGTATGI